MPYSPNPHKYPPEMEQILHALMMGKTDGMRLPCDTIAEAFSRKTQLQCYFAAVERHAKELHELMLRTRTRSLAGKGKDAHIAQAAELEYREAEQLTALWEARALATHKWQVGMQRTPPVVFVSPRKVSARFAESVALALGGGAQQAQQQDWKLNEIVDGCVEFIINNTLPSWWPTTIDPALPTALSQALGAVFPDEAARALATAQSLVMLRKAAGIVPQPTG